MTSNDNTRDPHEVNDMPKAPTEPDWSGAGPSFSGPDPSHQHADHQAHQQTHQHAAYPAPQGQPYQPTQELPPTHDTRQFDPFTGFNQDPDPTQPTPHESSAGFAAPVAAPRTRTARRPGWAAMLVAMLGTALLASGLTAGAIALTDEPSAPSSVSAPASGSSQAPSVGAPVTDGTLDWQKVAAAVSPSVVAIKVAGENAAGAGSGVLLDKQGHVLTNNHVVTGGGASQQIQVVLNDGRVYSDVKVVGLDPSTDLAVLKLTNPPSDLTPAALGDSSKVVVGQPVMAVGNPLGLADTVTTGIVSATNRPISTTQDSTPQQQQSPFGNQQQSTSAETVITNAIQTDAAVNPGNSGGALVDATGSVIGIPSSIASTGSSSSQAGSIGLGFAIPVNEAKRIAEELISTGKATHSWLGVSLTDGTANADGTTRQGAKLAQIVNNTPAAKAGLKTGDVITTIDGEQVSGAESLTAQIRERAPGTGVTLDVVRGGSLSEVKVTLGTKQN